MTNHLFPNGVAFEYRGFFGDDKREDDLLYSSNKVMVERRYNGSHDHIRLNKENYNNLKIRET